MRRQNPDGSYSWNQTEVRMADAKAYLAWTTPLNLASIDTEKKYLKDYNSDIVNRGKTVFADNCARCHSSEQPKGMEIPKDLEPASDKYRNAMRAIVTAPDFLTKEPRNFLSTDRRYSAAVIDANIARSMGTNATRGHIWDNFSSETYKNLPSIGTLEMHNPLGDKKIKFKAPDGGRGYYRVASLVNIWSTAPWLHNQSMGEHVQDPSLEGRMKAFDSAAEAFFWPEKREPYIKVSQEASTFELPNGIILPLPKGTPVKLIANLPLHDLAELTLEISKQIGITIDPLANGGLQPEAAAKINKILDTYVTSEDGKLLRLLFSLEKAGRLLIKQNLAPDFVENRGHDTIVKGIGSDDDKRALIEFIKHF
jgi:hypothetical protein